MFVGFAIGCAFLVGANLASSDESATAADHSEKAPKTKPTKAKSQSTLSSLGIDFGAAELGRFTELGLSGEQKQQALLVVRERSPHIEKLCGRMTKALKMDEASLPKKQAKQVELEAIVKQFKLVQSEILSGLHAIVTPDQMTKLEAIKKREAKSRAASAGASG